MAKGIAAHPASWGVFSWNVGQSKPWADVLDEMADAGYGGVELGRFGFLPTDPAQLGSALAERHLQLAAGFVVAPLDDPDALAETLAHSREICSLLAAVGAGHLVVLDAIGKPRRSPTAGRFDAAARLEPVAWANLIAASEAIGEVAREHGLEMAFHPHAGTHVEFEDEVEKLLAETDPSLVGLCLDTGHSHYAGIDPVDLYERHAGRVGYIHLKDIDEARLASALSRRLSFQDAVGDGVFCPLGEGMVDLPRLRDALHAHGYDGWLTVEQDRLGETSRTAKEDAEECLACLRAIGLVEEERAHS
jgi:inosose dehydratase